MPKQNHIGTDQLRKGRVSIPHARYFITISTRERKSGLNSPVIEKGITEAFRKLHKSKVIVLHCATIMPDHVHCLFTLGTKLTLSQTQGKFKSLTRTALKTIDLDWQSNFYDHRLRNDALLEPFARYIYLNPYRKHLCPVNQIWSGWILNKDYRPEFVEHLVEGSQPPAEWLGNQAKDSSIKDLIQQDFENQRNK